jgi:glycosyltransferase involved in cell wall biosynthesis
MRENIIIIPAYKPNMGLLDIVRSLKQIFKYLIIVNDGSGDEYLNIFHDVESMGCTVLHHYVNMGKGRALKTAFNEAIHIMKEHGEVSWGGVITADADGQHMIEDIVKISNILEADEDSLVLGCREFDSKQVPFKSKFGNTLTRFVFKYLC